MQCRNLWILMVTYHLEKRNHDTMEKSNSLNRVQNYKNLKERHIWKVHFTKSASSCFCVKDTTPFTNGSHRLTDWFVLFSFTYFWNKIFWIDGAYTCCFLCLVAGGAASIYELHCVNMLILLPRHSISTHIILPLLSWFLHFIL